MEEDKTAKIGTAWRSGDEAAAADLISLKRGSRASSFSTSTSKRRPAATSIDGSEPSSPESVWGGSSTAEASPDDRSSPSFSSDDTDHAHLRSEAEEVAARVLAVATAAASSSALFDQDESSSSVQRPQPRPLSRRGGGAGRAPAVCRLRSCLPHPFYYYRDRSRDVATDGDPNSSSPLVPPGRSPNFPLKMHAILSRPDLQHISTWLPHGRSWRIIDPNAFERNVLPQYFDHGKFSSFIRIANGWGFRRVTTGCDRGTYYHELFLRGLPRLCREMRRPGIEPKEPGDTNKEPNFYEISRLYPVPEVPLDGNAERNGFNGRDEGSVTSWSHVIPVHEELNFPTPRRTGMAVAQSVDQPSVVSLESSSVSSGSTVSSFGQVAAKMRPPSSIPMMPSRQAHTPHSVAAVQHFSSSAGSQAEVPHQQAQSVTVAGAGAAQQLQQQAQSHATQDALRKRALTVWGLTEAAIAMQRARAAAAMTLSVQEPAALDLASSANNLLRGGATTPMPTMTAALPTPTTAAVASMLMAALGAAAPNLSAFEAAVGALLPPPSPVSSVAGFLQAIRTVAEQGVGTGGTAIPAPVSAPAVAVDPQALILGLENQLSAGAVARVGALAGTTAPSIAVSAPAAASDPGSLSDLANRPGRTPAASPTTAVMADPQTLELLLHLVNQQGPHPR